MPRRGAVLSARARGRVRPDPVPTVVSVLVEPEFQIAAIGVVVSYTATPLDAQGQAIPGKVASWDTTTPAVLSITPTGDLSADAETLAEGSGQVRATVDGVVGTAVLEVQLSDIDEMHLVHGDDGTGDVVRAFLDQRGFVTASGELTEWRDSRGAGIGADLVLTPNGSAIVPSQGIVPLNGTDNRLVSGLDLDIGGGFTLVIVASAESGAANVFLANLVDAARDTYMGVRRNGTGSGDSFAAEIADGGGPVVLNSGVVHSSALRVIVVSVDDLGLATIEVLDGASDAAQAVILPAGAYRLVLGAFSEVATAYCPADVLAVAAIALPTLNAQQRAFWAGWAEERGASILVPAQDPDEVQLDTSNLVLTPGHFYDVVGTALLSGQPVPGATIQYLSDNSGVASVNSSGRVSYVGNGSTTIRARTPLTGGGFVEDTCAVSCETAVATRLSVSSSSLTVPQGQTRSILVTVRDQAEADGQDIGFLMTAGYTLDASDTPGTGDVSTMPVSLSEIEVEGDVVGTAVVLVEIDGGALSTNVNVTVSAPGAATTFHIADQTPFYWPSVDPRHQSEQIPVQLGSLKHFAWTVRPDPAMGVSASPDEPRTLLGNVTHFAGRQASFFLKAALQIVEGGVIPSFQCTIKFAASVTSAQLQARLRPCLYVWDPNARVVVGHLYDPPSSDPEGLGDDWNVGTLEGREVSFITSQLAGVPRGSVICLDLWCVGDATYNGYGTPRANGTIGLGDGQASGNANTDGWTPGITLPAGMAISQTSDEVDRPDYRLTADAVVNGSGQATIALDYLPPANYSTIPDDNQLYPRHGYSVALGGDEVPVDGSPVSGDAALVVEFDTTIDEPASGVPCYIDVTRGIRFCHWRQVNGAAIDLSRIVALDRDGVDVTGSHPISISSDTPAVASVSGTTVTPGASTGNAVLTIESDAISTEGYVRVNPSLYGQNQFVNSPIAAATHIRTFESIATANQPSPDTNTRGTLGTVGGAQGWDQTPERNGFSGNTRGHGRIAIRSSDGEPGVLGFTAPTPLAGHQTMSGIIIPDQVQIDPLLGPTDPPYSQNQIAYFPNTVANRNLRRQIEEESRMALSNPTPDGSVFYNRFRGMNGGVGVGTLQSVQSGSTAWLVLQPDVIEAWSCWFFDWDFQQNGILQKGDYCWMRQNRASVGQIGPNYVPSFYPVGQAESVKQSLDYTHVGLRFAILGQGHPENNGGPVPGEGFDANGAALRPTYQGNDDGIAPRGRWIRIHYMMQHSSGPGQDDGVFYLGMDHGDGQGERQVLHLNNVRTWFTDSSECFWQYVQRVAVRGGGLNPVLRRVQRIYSSDWAWRIG